MGPHPWLRAPAAPASYRSPAPAAPPPPRRADDLPGLVGYLLHVIQPFSGHAVVQQLGVRHAGEHAALGGDVARHLDLTHNLANLDELRRAGVLMLFETPPFRPAIRGVVVSDIAEQEIGRRLVHYHAHAAIHPNRPEVSVPGPVDAMELQTRLRRIELQIERRRLRGPLLLAGQLGEAVSKGDGYAEVHAVPVYPWESACARLPALLQRAVLMVIGRSRNSTLARFRALRLIRFPWIKTG